MKTPFKIKISVQNLLTLLISKMDPLASLLLGNILSIPQAFLLVGFLLLAVFALTACVPIITLLIAGFYYLNAFPKLLHVFLALLFLDPALIIPDTVKIPPIFPSSLVNLLLFKLPGVKPQQNLFLLQLLHARNKKLQHHLLPQILHYIFQHTLPLSLFGQIFQLPPTKLNSRPKISSQTPTLTLTLRTSPPKILKASQISSRRKRTKQAK